MGGPSPVVFRDELHELKGEQFSTIYFNILICLRIQWLSGQVNLLTSVDVTIEFKIDLTKSFPDSIVMNSRLSTTLPKQLRFHQR
jgi:hypothetical protein